MRAMPLTIGVIHFVGIGGIGMSGIAEVLHNLGYRVQGTDASENANVQRLRAFGIPVAIGHSSDHLRLSGDLPAVVVVSSAIKSGNPEIDAARAALVPVVRRAEMLAELMRLKWAIAVGGTHGKTTTTSLVATLLEQGNLDPTVINGGIINAYGTNARLGSGEWMVVEADESDGSFTKLPATIALVTNIDPEHMEHYGSIENLRVAFQSFVQNIPFYGFAVLCIDHPEVQAMIPKVSDRRIITYGFNPQADVRAIDVSFDKGAAHFSVVFKNRLNGGEQTVRNITLPMLGKHNVQNALAALAVGNEMNLPDTVLQNGFSKFSGVKRRFTRTGESHGVTVIDDYGHHPVEISAVLAAARQAVGDDPYRRVIAVMQPHRYTRLHSLFEGFCACFNDADTVIITDVYAAGESPIEGADRDSLVLGLRAHGHRHVLALNSPSELAAMIHEQARTGDIVICLGAGNITQWAHALPGELDALYASGLTVQNGDAA